VELSTLGDSVTTKLCYIAHSQPSNLSLVILARVKPVLCLLIVWLFACGICVLGSSGKSYLYVLTLFGMGLSVFCLSAQEQRPWLTS